jgi:ferredoxin
LWSTATCVKPTAGVSKRPPAVFEIRDDDQMYILDENPGEDQRQAVETAVANCPRQALSLHD